MAVGAALVGLAIVVQLGPHDHARERVAVDASPTPRLPT